MKRLTVFLLLSIILNNGYCNELKKSLKGVWLCTKILDKNNQPTNGKFGASDEYLKFTFNKSTLSITEAAFDPSFLTFSIGYGQNYIDLIPGSIYKIPEQVYYVKTLTKDDLVLVTLNSSNDSIYYHFTNETVFIKKFNPKTSIIDLGLIIVKHLEFDNNKGANRVSQYIIPNTPEFLNPSPIFNDYNSASFGHYFSINFKFPESFPIDSISKELIIDFDIESKIIDNINIVQGINPELDKETIRIIEKTKKKWKPLKIDDEEIKCKVRLHLIFYLGKMELMKFMN